MRNPPMIACLFTIAHTQVNIFIKPYFWEVYPIYKKIIVPTSRGFLFVSGFLQVAIGKERSSALEVTRTIKKLIPLGKKTGTPILNFRTITTIFFSFTIYVFIFCSLWKVKRLHLLPWRRAVEAGFLNKEKMKAYNYLNFMLRQWSQGKHCFCCRQTLTRRKVLWWDSTSKLRWQHGHEVNYNQRF